MKNQVRTIEELQEKRKNLVMQRQYLSEFIHSCYKGSDIKQKVETELKAFDREIELLNWVLIEEDLPF